MDNIETKINMLYDFIYSKSFKGNIKEIDINENNINMDDIKIKLDGDNYDNILSELFSGKFRQIDNNNNTLLLKRYTDNLSIYLYISPYIKTSDADAMDNSNNNDSLFSYLLSSLVVKKKTNNILLPIINFDIEFDKIKHIIKTNEIIYNEINEKIEIDEINTKLSIRIREHFFDTFTLKDYLEKNTCSYKSLLFQIIHTLAIIQKEYPNFRHNNLTIDNILLYTKKDQSNTKYEFNNKKWEFETDFEEFKANPVLNEIFDIIVDGVDDKFIDEYVKMYLNGQLGGPNSISNAPSYIDAQNQLKKIKHINQVQKLEIPATFDSLSSL